MIHCFSKMEHYVFVYGTLKKNEPNHKWLLDRNAGYAKLMCKATTVDKYPLVIASRFNIPFLLDVAGQGHNVTGELYEVDYPMLLHLDVLEKHPDFYIREMRDVQAEGKIVAAWVYLLQVFRPDLLNEPFLKEYSSLGDHSKPYVERADRDPDHSAQDDVQDSNLTTQN